jgi:hypothetical protein
MNIITFKNIVFCISYISFLTGSSFVFFGTSNNIPWMWQSGLLVSIASSALIYYFIKDLKNAIKLNQA